MAQIDINEKGRIAALVQQALDETKRLDIMVNNAGLEYPGSIIDGEMDKWREMVDTNILALLAGCQAGVKAMRSCGTQGHIVNVSSVSAQRPNSGVYGATKHAVNVISSSLRDELENDDIRITNVLPGATSTNFARNFPPAFANSLSAPRDWIFPLPPASFYLRKHWKRWRITSSPCCATPSTSPTP